MFVCFCYTLFCAYLYNDVPECFKRVLCAHDEVSSLSSSLFWSGSGERVGEGRDGLSTILSQHAHRWLASVRSFFPPFLSYHLSAGLLALLAARGQQVQFTVRGQFLVMFKQHCAVWREKDITIYGYRYSGLKSDDYFSRNFRITTLLPVKRIPCLFVFFVFLIIFSPFTFFILFFF